MHQLQLQPSTAYATLSWARMFDVMKQYCALYSQPLADQVGTCFALGDPCSLAYIAAESSHHRNGAIVSAASGRVAHATLCRLVKSEST